MSSILDALKKSEAERQRGTPPTLDSPIVFQRRPAAARRRPLWLLPALAVAAVVGAWYGGLLPWPTPAEPAAGPAGAPTLPAAAGPDLAVANPGKDPAAEAAAPLAAGAVAVPVEPAPAPDSGAPVAIPSRGFYGGGSARPGATAPAPADADPVPGTELSAPGTGPVPAVAAGDPGAPAAAPGAGPPSVHDLPFALRRELPELKITMHMYSTDPQRRFVLLNGVRARDGDALEGGLEVVEIRATDIVLRFQGNEFVLPLRG